MRTFLCLAALAVLLLGCSSGSKHSDSNNSTSSSTIALPAGSSAQPSPKDALEKLLAAEKNLDHKASFQYVLHRADQPYPTVTSWTKRREDVPQVTGYTVEAGDDAQAVATVEHKPGLDPFVGLSPARERQTWTAVRAGDGWLLLEKPDVVPQLPPDSGAVTAAQAWVAAVQSCDRAAAAKLEAVETLFDSTSTTPQLCHASGGVAAGAVGPLPPGPASGDIVAQYTADALSWARVVQIDAPTRFAVVLAPIGENWKVLGLTDHS